MSMFHRAGVFAVAALSVSPAFAAEAPSAESAQAAVALVSDGVAAKDESDPACPKIVFAPDGGVFPKKDDDYAATVEALARDCANLGAETILKVAVVGEGTRDSAKGPSWFNAPLRVAVKDGEGHEVETRKIRVKVEMPDGVQKVSFNHLEANVSLPPAPEGGYRNWTVTVGFDPAASAAASAAPAPKAAKAVRSAAVKRATRVARAPAVMPPLPVAAPAPAAGRGDMRTQFQLIQRRTDRTVQTTEAAVVEQRQRQLSEQAKAQADARARAQARGQQINTARVEARRAKAEQAKAEQAKPEQAKVETRIPPQAAAKPAVRTAYNVR